MKLKTQFLLSSGLLVVVLAGMVIFGTLTRLQLADLGEQHNLAISLEQQANDLAYLASNYLLYHEPAQKDRWDTVFATFSADAEQLRATGARDAGIITNIRSNAERLREVFKDVVSSAPSAGTGAGQGESFLQVSWSRMEVQDREILFSAGQLHTLLEEKLDHANLVSAAVVFAMMGLFGLLLLGGYVFMYRRTIAGISALRDGTEIIGRGDLDHSIPGDTRDEIGDLARAFNAMTSHLKSVTSSKAELEEEVAERKRVEAEREELLEELMVRNDELAEREAELAAQNEQLSAQEEELRLHNDDLRAAEEETARLLSERSSLFERLQTGHLHLPQELPGVRFSHLYRSATRDAKVGGDFYDVFETRHHMVGLLIGDVSGHGIEAARIATLVKDTVHAFTHQFRRPHLVLRETNRVLVERNLPGFVTVFVGFLDTGSGALTFSSAGHPPPLLVSNGRFVTLESSASPLGVFPDARYSDKEVAMTEESLLLLYTDGITDVPSSRQMFGEERLGEAMSRYSGQDVEKVPGLLLDEALRFSDGRLEDDVALLAVSYLGLPHSAS
jgi:serine phosphatase RsbU (regulator of sigma subunit)